MSTTLSVSQVAQMPDESWINDSVAAHVLKVETVPKKAGGNFFKATLGDAPGDFTNSVSMSLFTVPKFQQGDQIRISGKGIKKNSYMGKAQIGTGKDTTIEVIPGSPRVAQAAHAAGAEKQNGEMINGQAVGNAMSNAWEVARHCYSGAELKAQLSAPAFWGWMHTIASDHLRIARMIEHGHLSDPVKTRGGGAASVRQAAPSPRQQPQHDPERELDEEFVPF